MIWGDDATLQLAAVVGDFRASAGSHPAWIALAHLFTKLPVGELAYRVNLAAAFSAAAALGLLFLTLRLLPISRSASVIATLCMGVSHTFWAHAVRPEVYAMTLATMALLLWALLRWYHGGQWWFLLVIGLALGLAITTHLLVALYLPAVAWLLFVRRRQLGPGGAALLTVSALIALLPLGWLLWRDSRILGMNTWEVLRWALFTFEGHDFSGQMLRWSGASLLSDVQQWLLFLGYQFVGPGLIFGAIGSVAAWRRMPRVLAIFVGLLYVISAAFAFSYQVGDRYVFYLPSYLAFAVWIALGAEQILIAVRNWKLARPSPTALMVALVALIIVIPPLAYRLTPWAMQESGFSFREGRYVPGPNSRYFVLWPPKVGYYDARVYAEAALSSAPANALFLADPLLATPMIYLQQVEGLRGDVTVRFCCWDMDEALATNMQRPLVLADVTPEIYPMIRLERDFFITQVGPIYMLTPQNERY
ncbi:MAG: DUF2723 domain-containing protein [Caldilinea sp.]